METEEITEKIKKTSIVHAVNYFPWAKTVIKSTKESRLKGAELIETISEHKDRFDLDKQIYIHETAIGDSSNPVFKYRIFQIDDTTYLGDVKIKFVQAGGSTSFNAYSRSSGEVEATEEQIKKSIIELHVAHGVYDLAREVLVTKEILKAHKPDETAEEIDTIDPVTFAATRARVREVSVYRYIMFQPAPIEDKHPEAA